LEAAIKKTAVILVVYKQKQHLELLYKSLAEQSYKDFIIYFVDNNPGEEESDFSRKLNSVCKLDITYIKPGFNSGFAGGNNFGARSAMADGCEYIFFLNNDVMLAKDCIARLVESLGNNCNAGAAGPLILFGKPTGKEGLIQELGAKADFDSYKIFKYFEGKDYSVMKDKLPAEMKVDLISGGAALVRAGILKTTGLWEERYFAYGDEIDFARRVKQAGYKTIAVSSAVLYHNHSWVKNNKQGFYFEYYLIQRNKFLYFHKYKKYFRLIVSFFSDSVKFPWRLLWFMKICDLKLGIYYLRGMFAGLMNKKGAPIPFIGKNITFPQHR